VKRSSRRTPLVDELLLKIFRGDYPAGADLPAERQLAVDLGVDRTTLRMALKQLERMGLLQARHGSGIRVIDWREGGGLDALAAMFGLDALPLEGSFIVEALDFWIDTLASMVAKAVARMSLDEMRTIERHLEGGRVDDIMEVQDLVAQLSGSVFFRMLSNSTRAVRERVVRLLADTDDVGAGLEELRKLLRTAAITRPTEDLARRSVLEALRRITAKLRERLLFGVTPTAKAVTARAGSRNRGARGAARRLL
jgi:GntR family transcriptional repressor for pyruvate dehydrogenase complex